MANVKVVPRSLTDAYKRREGDFSPDLVGLQLTDEFSLFTFGNFAITTNFDGRLTKDFKLGGEWSDYYSLDNLNMTEEESVMLESNNIFVRLNFNPLDIGRYVYFGSFHEFLRTSIEQIITKWKGSLYINPVKNNVTFNTVLSFSYDYGINQSKFLIPVSTINNQFELIINDNNDFGSIPGNEIYNLSRDYPSYVLWDGVNNFKVVGYTGSTSNNPYLSIITEGNPFPTLTASTFGQFTYHIKPNNTEVELFFKELDDFESIILNRLSSPIYTSFYDVPKDIDGVIVFYKKSFTWPITDGYNLDINTDGYSTFLRSFLEMADSFDQFKTDLISRRFVSESIHEYDTNGGGDEIYGMKVTKLLRIYGREFDEVKKYIDGISFANVVTYDKLDNTSDNLINMMAKTLGFDTLLTINNNNFNVLEQLQISYETPFSGYSRSLSVNELNVELWRRLVINAWWLWKSKGTRKVIEFFFKLFNIPQCMISFDEYVYLANSRLDFGEVYEQLLTISLLRDTADNLFMSDYPLDVYGFPRILPETNDNYFQMGGFWYNGGTDSTIGNNPHIGPYDYGKSYFSQFECFVEDFQSLATGTTTVRVNENYFNNYNEGSFIFDQNGLPVPYYGTGYANTLNTESLVQNAVVNSAGLTYIGGNNSPNYSVPSGDTYAMKINFTAGIKSVCEPCSYNLIYGENGIVYIKGEGENPDKPLIDRKCCQNYWLPSRPSSSVVCPRPTEVVITSPNSVLGPCIVLDMTGNDKKPVSQECCSRQTLGFDVAWDGEKCVDINCLGLNGSDFEIATGVEDFQKSFSITEIPLDIQFDPIDFLNFKCYWCPPENFIQTICSTGDYLNALTDTQIINLATTLGASQPITLSEASVFIGGIYDPFFTTYGCLLLDNKDEPITNKLCCEMRGGVYTLINNKNYCIKPTNNPCANVTILNANHIWVNTDDNSLISYDCCSTVGGTWTDGTITISSSMGTIQDNLGLSYANGLGLNSYCTSCPTNIMFVDDCVTTPNLCVSIVKDGLTNTDLTQQCCTDYGYTWNSNTNKCYVCPTVVNNGGSYPYTITTLNGGILPQNCCESQGGWYGLPQLSNSVGEIYNPKTNACYQCPPLYYYTSESSTAATQNINYSIIFLNTQQGLGGEVVYNGQSLSQQCCDNYNITVGGVYWNTTFQKCMTV